MCTSEIVAASVKALRGLAAFAHFDDGWLERLARLGTVQRRARFAHYYHEGAAADGTAGLFVLISVRRDRGLHSISARLASTTAGAVSQGIVSIGRAGGQPGVEVRPGTAFGLEALAAVARLEGEALRVSTQRPFPLCPPTLAMHLHTTHMLRTCDYTGAVRRGDSAVVKSASSVVVRIPSEYIRSMAYELAVGALGAHWS